MGTLLGQGLHPGPAAYLVCADVQKTQGIVAPDLLLAQHVKIPSSPEQLPQPAARYFFVRTNKSFAQNGIASGAMGMGLGCVGAHLHGRPSGVAVDPTGITETQGTPRFSSLLGDF